MNRDDPGGPQGMVRVLRVRAGLTQEQLAELSGLSVRAISDIERGTTTRPRRSSIALLAAALRQFGENATAPAAPLAPAVQQLPPAVPGFTGRARELNALTQLLVALRVAAEFVTARPGVRDAASKRGTGSRRPSRGAVSSVTGRRKPRHSAGRANCPWPPARPPWP